MKILTDQKRWVGIYDKVRARHARIAGIEEDPGMRAYDKLTPEHFRNLVLEYGINDVSKFIENMEARKHGVAQKAPK